MQRMRALIVVSLAVGWALLAAGPAFGLSATLVTGVPTGGYPPYAIGSQVTIEAAGFGASVQEVRYVFVGQQSLATAFVSDDRANNFRITVRLTGSTLNYADHTSGTLYAYAYNSVGADPTAWTSQSYPPTYFVTDLSADVRFIPPTEITPHHPVSLYPNPPAIPISTTDVRMDLVPWAGNTDVRCVQWSVDSSDPSSFVPDLPADPSVACANPPASKTSVSPPPSASWTGSYTGSTMTATGLSEGTHTIYARVRDLLGNIGLAQATFLVDRTPPALSIISGPDPGGVVTDSSIGIGLATDASYPAVVLYCALDEPVATRECNSASNRSFGESGVGDGPHTFIATAFDFAGNSSAVSRAFTVAVPGGQAATTTPSGFPSSGKITGSTGTTGSRKRVQARISLKTTRGRRAKPSLRPTTRPWLTVTKVSNGSAITISCTAPKRARSTCPFKSRRYKIKDGKSKLGRAWTRRKLRTGTVVTIRVTGTKAIGRAVRYTVGSWKAHPRRQVYCMPAGSTKLKKSC